MRLLFLLMLIDTSLYGQFVDSIVVSPANPTTNDTVVIYCYVQYPQSTCKLSSSELVSAPEGYIGKAIHCQMVLLTLCPVIDTFYIGVVNAGDYKFHYWPGFNPQCIVPMLPNGNPIPYPSVIDSTTFTVEQSSSVINPSNNFEISLTPNPSSRRVSISLNHTSGFRNPVVRVFDLLGNQVLQQTGHTNINAYELDITELANGIYFILINDNYLKINVSKKIIKS